MEEFEQIAYEQGWDDGSIIIHLKGFIAKLDAAFNGTVYEGLSDYAREAQAEENAGMDRLCILGKFAYERNDETDIVRLQSRAESLGYRRVNMPFGGFVIMLPGHDLPNFDDPNYLGIFSDDDEGDAWSEAIAR